MDCVDWCILFSLEASRDTRSMGVGVFEAIMRYAPEAIAADHALFGLVIFGSLTVRLSTPGKAYYTLAM